MHSSVTFISVIYPCTYRSIAITKVFTGVPYRRCTIQVYHTGVPYRCTKQVYHTGGVPYSCTIQLYHIGVPYRCTIQVYHTGVPYRCTIQVYHTGVPYRCAIQVYHTGVPHRCTIQGCQKMQWNQLHSTTCAHHHSWVLHIFKCTYYTTSFPLPVSSTTLGSRSSHMWWAGRAWGYYCTWWSDDHFTIWPYGHPKNPADTMET